jgi:hypothetical protein
MNVSDKQPNKDVIVIDETFNQTTQKHPGSVLGDINQPCRATDGAPW